METPNLDKEIEWLEWAKNGTNWNSEREKQLAEYKEIKQALRIHDVVGQSEQLQGFFEFYKQKFGGGFNTDVLEITLKQYQETL